MQNRIKVEFQTKKVNFASKVFQFIFKNNKSNIIIYCEQYVCNLSRSLSGYIISLTAIPEDI